MKWLAFLCFTVIAVIGIDRSGMKWSNYLPQIDIANWGSAQQSATGVSSAVSPRKIDPHRVIKSYRWRLADGSWQYSDQPPADGTEYQTLYTGTSSDQSAVVSEPDSKRDPDNLSSVLDGNSALAPLKAITRIPELLEEAGQVQNLLNERRQREEQMLEDINGSR